MKLSIKYLLSLSLALFVTFAFYFQQDSSAQSPARAKSGSDWADWRGPFRDGTSLEKGLPEKWSKDGDNLLWKAPYGGRSAPIVMNGRVFIFNTSGEGETLQERVIALDAETGKLLWSTPGFDGINSRIVRQGNAEYDQTEVFVVVSATGPAQDDGAFEQSVTGVLAATGERIWDNAMQGPLVQPVNNDEDKVVVTANQLLTGKNVPADSTPIVDGESFNHYNWTSTDEAIPEGGGQRLFALQADTGEIVWIRTTAAGGFTDLATKFPTGGGTLRGGANLFYPAMAVTES